MVSLETINETANFFFKKNSLVIAEDYLDVVCSRLQDVLVNTPEEKTTKFIACFAVDCISGRNTDQLSRTRSGPDLERLPMDGQPPWRGGVF